MQVVTNMFSKMDSNDLGALKNIWIVVNLRFMTILKAIEYS